MHTHTHARARTHFATKGCMAALAAERYLAHNNLIQEVKTTQDADDARAAKLRSDATATAAARAAAPADDTARTFDIDATAHSGAYALRRLYHESDRPIVVKYVSPTVRVRTTAVPLSVSRPCCVACVRAVQ
jgi:thioredoxin reductase (NADPH)